MALTDAQFTQAATHWDLDTLYTDLASAKGKRMTPVEKLHLRGLLCGYSPAEIAEKLNKSVKGVEADLCNTVYRYVKNLVGKCDETTGNWRNIYEWLHEAGYKTHPSVQVQLSNCLPVDLLVKKANISFDKNQIIIDINMRIIAPSVSEDTTEEIELGDRSINNTNHTN